jgi:hypothetical protein
LLKRTNALYKVITHPGPCCARRGSGEDDDKKGFERERLVVHGALDGPDREILAGRELMYLHITGEVHPTYLLLVRDSRLGSAEGRIGVATIFELGDAIMDPPFRPGRFTDVVVE